jgi:integrase
MKTDRGHIQQRGQNFKAQIYIGRDSCGKPKYRSKTLHTRTECRRWITAQLAAIDAGKYVDPSRETLSDYLDYWLRIYAAGNVQPKTFERYTEIINKSISPAIGHHRLSALKPEHIQDYYAELMERGREGHPGPLSPQTVLTYHRILSQALSAAVGKKITSNPCQFVVRPKQKRRPCRVLTPPQARDLIQASAASVYHIPILIALFTGLRRGEVLALKWDNVDLQSGEITVRESLEETEAGLRTKGPKSEAGYRTIPIDGYLVQALKDHRKKQQESRCTHYQDHALVYCREDGFPLQPDAFSRNFARFMRSDKLKHIPRVTFHGLRHTFISFHARICTNAAVTRELAGHADLSTTLAVYTHTDADMRREANTKLSHLIQPDNANIMPDKKNPELST